MSDFAKNLKLHRKLNGFTQQELAKRLNYGYTAIANYENGRNEPCIDDLIRIAVTLRITVDELVGLDHSTEDLIFLRIFQQLNDDDKDLITNLIIKLYALT